MKHGRGGNYKTFSGLMKILFPHGGASSEETEELLRFAIEGRKRVKDQLMRIDTTYAEFAFHYSDTDGNDKAVTTLEEVEYPHHYHRTLAEPEQDAPAAPEAEKPANIPTSEENTAAGAVESAKERHVTYSENQKGASYVKLFGPYIQGATQVTVTDPYIRLFYQVRNFMEKASSNGKISTRLKMPAKQWRFILSGSSTRQEQSTLDMLLQITAGKYLLIGG
jgi:ATP-dependent Lon protease